MRPDGKQSGAKIDATSETKREKVKLDIRTADPSDVKALVRLNRQVQSLHAALYPNDFKANVDDDELSEFILATMDQYGNRIAIAEIAGNAVGYVWFEVRNRPETALTFAKRTVFLQQICISSDNRRQKIGSALMRHVEQFATKENADEIILGAWSSNETARSFFPSCGFEAFTILLRKHLAP
jgi:ribosomal protein S18 acetylase RimI-like enzyme